MRRGVGIGAINKKALQQVEFKNKNYNFILNEFIIVIF
jgi:hypothetical protein